MTVRGISIHCFDIARGVVAEGLRVEVFALAPQRSSICKGAAGPDAMVAHPALAERFDPGTYEIAFHVADYFRAAGLGVPDIPFLDVPSYRFSIDRADMHYHLPFKVTPWGYSLFVTTSG
jgi:5-hydroxyisourate hydrolase